MRAAHPNHGLNFLLDGYSLPDINLISLDRFEFYSGEEIGGRGPQLLFACQ